MLTKNLLQVSRILNISVAPVRVHSRLLPQCIAQYTVGHRARVQSAKDIIRWISTWLDNKVNINLTWHDQLEALNILKVLFYPRSQKIPLSLVGSSYDGPGINDTIMSSKKAVIQH